MKKNMNQARSSHGITIKIEERTKVAKSSSNQFSKNSPPSPLTYSTSNSGIGSNSSNSEPDILTLGLPKEFYDGTEGMSSSHSSPAGSPACVEIDHDMFCSSTVSLEDSLSLLNGSSQKCNSSTSDAGGVSCQRVCLVCGDVASGFHYGVASCEACKAFFKRTIQGNIEYTCPASGECEINKRRRKACQACRFTKCLAMGMLKEGVRLDRVRGGRQKYRKVSDSSFTTAVGVPCKKQALDDKLLEALQNCEPESLQARQDLLNNSSMDPTLKVMTILSDVIDRELVGAICWAKQIPGFTRLSFNDQMRLLKTSWSEILALLLAYRSLQTSGNDTSSSNTPVTLTFASNWTLNEQQAVDCGLEDIFLAVVQLMQRLDTLSLARDEYLALKALLLTNSDTQLENQSSVQTLRQHILSTLYECVVASCPASAVVHHYSELLLCFPLLRQLGTEIRAFWCQVRQEGKVSMNKLFIEMLEPHFPPRPR